MKNVCIYGLRSSKKQLIKIVIGILLFYLSPYVSAQITLNVNQRTIRETIRIIEQETSYKFFFNTDFMSLDKKVTLNVDDEPLEIVLEKLFQGTDITYRQEDDDLVILTLKTIDTSAPFVIGKTIKGVILDEDNMPVFGANVVEKGTTNGTITDINGEFTLAVNPGAILKITYIGYLEQEVKVGELTSLKIILKEDAQALEEVVVIGYGSVKKRDLTGAVSQVSSGTIQNQAVFKDPIQALQGKIPGADITIDNAPGSTSTIAIRGYTSLNANNTPLIVLDDAPFMGNIDEINPAEIESIDVLKDASSTAIYGSRGANGVVIITTKRARKGSKLSVSYDGYHGITKSFRDYDMMSGEKYADYKRMANYGKTDREIFDDIQLNAINTNTYVDWQDLMFSGTGFKTDHNISINQTAGRNRNVVVLGYNKDQSIIDNMSYERFSARMNGDMELATNFLVGYSSAFAFTTRNEGDQSVWKYGTVLDPLTQVYDENGDILYYNSGWYQTVLHSNPMFDTDKKNVDNTKKRFRALVNLFADWEIIPGLKIRSGFTYNHSSIEEGKYYSSTSQNRQLSASSATYQKDNEVSLLWTNLINYKKNIGLHNIDVSLVNDIQTYKYSYVGLTGQDMAYYGSWYNVNEAPDVFTRKSNIKEWALVSYMGRINYSFMDRYLLTLTGRYDGSSRLADGNKWDFFPSIALAWRVKEESFLKDIDVLTNLKLRLGWGNSGNTAIDEYATLGKLGKYAYYFGQTEQSAIGYLPTELANNVLGWERTEEFNIGIDYGFFNNRLSGTIDLYRKNTHDVLMERSLPYSTGYGSTWQNIGKTRNSGVELSINTIPVITKDFRWTMDVSFAYNKNQIIELFNGKEDSPGNNWFIGQPFEVARLYKYTGVWQTEEEEAARYGREPGNPKVYDANNNGTYDDEDRYLYNKIPKWTAGLSTGFSYKNFDLNIYLYARQKYGNVLGILTDEAGSTRYNHLDVDFWTPDNPSNTFPKPNITNSQNLLVQSDYSFRDFSFVRLKNINLGYTFPRFITEKIHSERLRVYFMVDNPYIWTKKEYIGLDPENCNSYNSHRPLTSFIFGINVTF